LSYFYNHAVKPHAATVSVNAAASHGLCSGACSHQTAHAMFSIHNSCDFTISSGLIFSNVQNTFLNNSGKSNGIHAFAASNHTFFKAMASSLLLSKSSKLDELASIFISYLSSASLNASFLILKNFQSLFFRVISLSMLSNVQSSIL